MNLKRTAVLFAAAALLAGCASTGGGEYFDDMKITAKVKSAIYNEPSLKVMDIGVKTDNQVVELSGAVKSRTERVKAAEVARKVQGVKSVKNELKVQ
jgi:osmotically-inducible protein OsmY